MKNALIALFDNVADAGRAVDRLAAAGIARGQVSVVAPPRASGRGKSPQALKARAAAGALAGAGFAPLSVPAAGAAAESGPLAAIGASAAGLLAALGGLGVKGREARYYADGVRSGRTMVALRADAPQIGKARDILRSSRPVKMREPRFVERAAQNAIAHPLYTPEDEILRARGSYGQPPEGPEKTAAGPEHWAPDNISYAGSFDEFAGIFKRHHATFLAGRGPDYDYYRPAYEFGFSAAGAARFAGRSWPQVVAEIRREWRRRKPGSWYEFHEAIEAGWDTARGV
jgi:hypothetical protein